jgi:hypothetical protein
MAVSMPPTSAGSPLVAKAVARACARATRLRWIRLTRRGTSADVHAACLVRGHLGQQLGRELKRQQQRRRLLLLLRRRFGDQAAQRAQKRRRRVQERGLELTRQPLKDGDRVSSDQERREQRARVALDRRRFCGATAPCHTSAIATNPAKRRSAAARSGRCLIVARSASNERGGASSGVSRAATRRRAQSPIVFVLLVLVSAAVCMLALVLVVVVGVGFGPTFGLVDEDGFWPGFYAGKSTARFFRLQRRARPPPFQYKGEVLNAAPPNKKS